MLEIIFLIAAGSGIAAYARGRSGNPWLWGALAIGGYFFAVWIAPIFIPIARDPEVHFWSTVAGFAWVGVIAFCARFLLGLSRKKPSGIWSCPNCRYLNQQYAVICEACKHPFGEPVATK